jgi:hypothetical protein
MEIDDIRVFQDIQMLGDIGLGDVEKIFDVVDTFLPVAQLLHDVDAERVGEGLENMRLLFEFFG